MLSRTAEIVITPPGRSGAIDFRELFAYREVLVGRVRKNLKAKFGDFYLGYVWAVAQPVLVVTVFVWLRRVSSAQMNVSMPYGLWVLSGLLLWYYFVDATTAVSTSARRDASLLKKVYFPRLLTPAVPLFENLFPLLLGLVPLATMMAWYGSAPGWRLVLLPVVVVQVMALVLGTGCLWAAFSLRGTDMERVLRIAFYLGLFVSPVLYAPGGTPLLSAAWLQANPMWGTLLAFRSCLFAQQPFPLGAWGYSVIVSFLMLFIGVRAYRAAEAELLDSL